MNAAFIHQPGPADNIVYGQLTDPVPAAGQALVRLLCATVNHVDLYIRSGAYPLELPSPFIIGRDMVGQVLAAGDGTGKFRPGDLVWANNQGYAGRQGSFAELLAIDESLLYRLPAEVAPATAVTLLHALLTVVVGLHGKASLKAGETLFLRGGSGSVGSAAIQVASRLGVRVITTAGSSENAEWCRRLGAQETIDYRHQSTAEALQEFAPGGVDVFWDMTTQADLALAADHTARRGRILLNSGLQRVSELAVGKFYTKNLSLFGFTVTDLDVAELQHWSQLINDYLPGLLIKPARMLALSQAAQAHRLAEAGETSGKIVVLPDSSSLWADDAQAHPRD